MFSVGLFDHPNDGNPTRSHDAGHRAAAEIAAAGSVLLRNERDVLRLGATSDRSP
jgi:beta-glucosidase-like glycosyl hydrolase